MTLDQRIAGVTAAGYHFNNLFQRHDGSWQCNLRTVPDHNSAGYGHGATPEAAIEAAFDLAETMPKNPHDIPAVLVRAPAAEAEDLLS